jgi:hypothetical protein
METAKITRSIPVKSMEKRNDVILFIIVCTEFISGEYDILFHYFKDK